MNILGIGPKFAIISFIYIGIMYGANYVYFPFLKFNPPLIVVILSILWLLIGNVLFFASAYTLLTKFYNKKLITSGVYKISRNPLYASFIIFIVPSITVLSGSFFLITSPVFMYLVFKILIKTEEHILKETFNQEYQKYCEKTPPLLLWI